MSSFPRRYRLFCTHGFFLGLLLCITAGRMSAQGFPVRTTVTIVTPSPYLEDYAEGTNLVVTATLLDNRPVLDGFLFLTLQGTDFLARTRVPLPLALTRGAPIVLRGPQLRDLIDLNNLEVEGFTIDNTVDNGGRLPDGPLTICAEFFAVNLPDQPVSNTGCGTRFVQPNDPPLLNLPFADAEVSAPAEITPFTFAWSPRHYQQPSDRYVLELFELLPGLSWDQVVRTGPLLFRSEPERVFSLRYNPLLESRQPALVVGKRYLWRVQVRDASPASDRTFVNGGFSEPRAFTYGRQDDIDNACPQIDRFFSQGLASDAAELGWAITNTDLLKRADLRYRAQGGDWTPALPVDENASPHPLRELTTGTNYEAELCVTCTNGREVCQTVKFTTLTETEDCGPLLRPTAVPLTENSVALTWPVMDEVAGYVIYWTEVVAVPEVSPEVPVREGRTRRQQRRRLVTRPGTRDRAQILPTVNPDSLRLPGTATEAIIEGLDAGTDYTVSFCKRCPNGTRECFEWTLDFNGVDDGCLTSLNFTRPDSTDTTLDLAWTYDPDDLSANDSFSLHWRVSDLSYPEESATVAYADGSYTITDRIPGQTYTLRVCAECTAGQPQCRDLEPFGGCPADYLPELVALDFKRALVGYAIEGGDPTPTELRYGMRSFANWNPLRPGTFVDFNPESYPLPADQLAETEKLQPGVVYLVELRNQCFDTLWSAWSPPVEFSISCAANEELYASEITDSSALIASLPIPNASYYQFYYRLADSGEDWTLLDNVPSFATPITGLLADTTYEVKMRFWCTLGVWSNFSPVLTFRTLPPCRPPAELSFSNVTYASFDLNWEPGENAEETTFRYRRVRRSVFPRPWREITFAGNTGTIDGLREGAIYEIIGSSDCGVNTSLPGVRDTVVLACAPPEIALTEVTIEDATLELPDVSPSSREHTFSYRMLGETDWLTAAGDPTPERTRVLAPLEDYTTYEARAMTTCRSGEDAPWSDTLQFRTPVDCRTPENLGVVMLYTDGADLRWDVTGTVTEWEVRLLDSSIPTSLGQQQQQAARPGRGTGVERDGSVAGDRRVGGTRPAGLTRGGPPPPPPNPYASWERFTTTDPSRVLTGLSSNRKYRVVVRAKCPEVGWTDYTEVLTFRTLCRQGEIDTAYAENILETTVDIRWSRIFQCLDAYQVQLESLEPLATTTAAEQLAGIGVQREGDRRLPSGGAPRGGQTNAQIYRDSITTEERLAQFSGLRANTEYRFRVRGRIERSVFTAGQPGYTTMAYWANVQGGEDAGAEIVGKTAWGPYTGWYTFRTDHCAQPYDFMEEPVSRSIIDISWTPSNGINNYEFKYRLQDDGAVWATLNVAEPYVRLENLLSNAVYEYQVTELCQNGTTTRPAPQDTFLMKKPSLNNGLYVCGLEVGVDLSNETPLAELFEDDTIRAFDFPVVITEVSGGGGTFSGVGEIRVPYFNKAKMEFAFENIFVNDEYQMVGGCMEATGFGIEVLPPWADTLLGGIITGLEMIDDMLQDEQVNQLDSLLQCCSDAIPPGLQADMEAIVNCFDQVDEANTAAFDSCEAMMDQLLLTIQEDLTEIIDSLEEEIIVSKTIDLIRLALDTLKVIHRPTIDGEVTAYRDLRSTFRTTYGLGGADDDEPPPLPSNMTLEEKTLPCAEGEIPAGTTAGGSSQLPQFREDAIAIRNSALTVTENHLYATLTGRIDEEPRSLIRTFAQVIRDGDPEDTDVFALTRALVEALGEGDDPADLIPQVTVLVQNKLNYLVRN